MGVGWRTVNYPIVIFPPWNSLGIAALLEVREGDDRIGVIGKPVGWCELPGYY